MALLEQSILLWKHLTKFSSWGNSASSVSQPKVLGAYNNFSSDFNKQDWLVSKWSTSIKDRNRLKIILVIIHWKINMHCECIIHKFVNKDKKDLTNILDFTRHNFQSNAKRNLQEKENLIIPDLPTTKMITIFDVWTCVTLEWQEQWPAWCTTEAEVQLWESKPCLPPGCLRSSYFSLHWCCPGPR